MKPEERKKRPGVRWVFFAYCLILVVVMLVLIWGLRLLFIDKTYKQVRTTVASETSQELVDVISSGRNFKEESREISANSDMTIALLDGDGIRVSLDNSGAYRGYELTVTEMQDIRNYTIDSKKGDFTKEIEIDNGDNNFKMLIYARVIDVGNYIEGIGPVHEGKGTIILTFGVKPMDAIMKTINIELIIMTVVMIIAAFIIAILLSRHVSKPIIDINQKSSRLAKGDYSVRFSDEGYREVAELGDMLNYTAIELGKTDRMRRDLIANVSHDLRTPLTMIRGYVEMMRDIPDENNAENMEVILKETDYLTKLVKDMLDISKLDSNVVEFHRDDFDINELLQDIADRYNALYKPQKYTFGYANLGQKVVVNSDKTMITNVIYNLINNAVNHIGDDGNVDITTEMSDGKMTIHIIDKGQGIEADKLDTIWDRYYKAERNLKRESAGSGLGLSIVKTVLNKLDCTYGVKSKIDEGSDFYFTIDVKSIENYPSDGENID